MIAKEATKHCVNSTKYPLFDSNPTFAAYKNFFVKCELFFVAYFGGPTNMGIPKCFSSIIDLHN